MANKSNLSGSRPPEQPGWSPYDVWRKTIHEPRTRARQLRAVTPQPTGPRRQSAPNKRSWRAIWARWLVAR